MPRLLCILLPIALTSAALMADNPKPKPVRVLIQTDKGDIEVELDSAKAPNTTAQLPQVRRRASSTTAADSTAPSRPTTSRTTR